MSTAPPLVLRNAVLGLSGRLVTVTVVDGRIASIVPTAAATGPVPAGGDAEVVDLAGATLLPGLWDHHVHMDQWALRLQWIDLSGAAGVEDVQATVRARLLAGPLPQGLPLVGYGFRDALWPLEPHRSQLDELSTEVELIMISADLHQAWLNSAALRRFGLPADGDGMVREDAWFPLAEEVSDVPSLIMDGWVDGAARAAAARGVVGVVDYESADNLTSWTRRHGRSPLPVRVRASAWPDHRDAAIAAGLRTGDPVPGTDGMVTMGHLKVITDGSLNTRTAFCYDAYPQEPDNVGHLSVPPAELLPLMQKATAAGLGCSIHAIGDHANTLALDAFERSGAFGSVEHAQLLTAADVGRFAALGVAASVQPEHAHDDRDVADHFWPGRTGRAFAFSELLSSGALLKFGSDAPVAPLDPFVTIGAAVSRSRDGRSPWHPEHEVSVAVALAASTGTGRTEPAVGDVADLVVTDVDLGSATGPEIRRAVVRGTLLAGRWTHRRDL